METVGKFEFSRKDLIGHGAFAVVFKGRHKEKHDWEVAVKCINKKNLAKSQTLLGKEIKILKYCNGGDLADYLHSKGTLSEDTIRVFLQQIAGAMRVLQAKGIIHRDLKPQNILLSYPPGRKSHSNNTCIKIADFGFARYLQNNMMAATLCGSPMYMAPEVIMSQSYDAKADLWSIGTIVFQCLTGKAPFQASSPQDLRLFYEKNTHLTPNIPRETSSHLRHLLLGLLQRNYKDRMDYGLMVSYNIMVIVLILSATPTVTMTCFPSSASASSCSSSSTSHLASPPSLADGQQVRPKALASPTQEVTGFLLKDSSGGAASSKNSSSCDTDDFVMVPATQTINPSSVSSDSIGTVCPSGCSGRPSDFLGSNYGNHGHSLPIPVPTQVHNYQRMEQNLQCPRQDGSARMSTPVRRCSSNSSLGYGRQGPSPPYGQGAMPTNRRLSLGGARPFQLSPQALIPLPHTELRLTSQQQTGLGSRLHSAPCLLECASAGGRQKIRKQHSDPVAVPGSGLMNVRPLHSSPRLSELMQRSPLPTILGSPSRVRTFISVVKLVRQELFFDNLSSSIAPPSGTVGFAPSSGSPAQVVFTVGSPPTGSTPPQSSRQRKYSGNFYGKSIASGELGETSVHINTDLFKILTLNHLPLSCLLEQQEHTDTVQSLRFTLEFALCLVEVAAARGSVAEHQDAPPPPLRQQQHSLVADQISSLSREWSYAEQLVLYLKSADLLSTALHTAKERVKEGKLYPSTTVKQVVKRLNELYKTSVASCRSLSTRLERFFSRKHRLMDQISSITAERLLFSHTVQMVQAAALDEMFHQGEASILRYHKALLLMEGLSMLLSEQEDILSVSKCKECIERRITALQSGLCV
uniref:non-specific serine/threonine protein kinase n=1 Tax=Periophthalmus magnuspinnatus TaxID=409849 RepID=A0A3B4B1S9_9GOBI